MQVILTALGGGTVETITAECMSALQQADLIIGAKRLLEHLPESCTGNRKAAVKAEEILEIIKDSGAEYVCVIFSGDTGFYSGTKKLLTMLDGFSVKVLPGISSVQLLAARLGRPWQEWHLVSAHGVDCNAIHAVMEGKEAFFLTGGTWTPAAICRQLTEAGLGGLQVIVGENLSYPDEKITCGTAEALAKKEFATLSVLLTEKIPERKVRGAGLPDDMFIRGNVPMTKREVRANILAKLAVQPEDIIWDVGAGTGSVSVELALAASRGWVYAVEYNPEGCDLIRKNKEKMGAWNLSVIEGKASQALIDLPIPQAVFIGGTKGEMDAVIKLALEKNPAVRICISAIAVETLTAAMETLKKYGIEPYVTQISVSKTKAIGDLHLLLANNPVFLITGGCHE